SVVSSVCACPCSVSFRQPPPPTFPPFPYTTLFRSGVLYDPGQREHWRLAEKPPAEFTARLRSHGVDPLAAGEVIVATRRPHDRRSESTRLNSSHVKISYAVFCLKKKKQA